MILKVFGSVAPSPYKTAKSQALDRPPLLPLQAGLLARQIHDYKRYGDDHLLAAFDILNGKFIESCLPRHCEREFIRLLNQLEKEVPAELEVHFILDNFDTQKSAEVQRGRKSNKRLSFHFVTRPPALPSAIRWLVWTDHRPDDPSRTFRGMQKLEKLSISGRLRGFIPKRPSGPPPRTYSREGAAV